MKHFEDLWEEAEKLSASSPSSLEEIITQIQKDINDFLLSEDKSFLLGKIVFNLTQISYKNNINVYASLIEAMNDFRSSILEQEENE